MKKTNNASGVLPTRKNGFFVFRVVACHAKQPRTKVVPVLVVSSRHAQVISHMTWTISLPSPSLALIVRQGVV
jgi:hypothetical protein